MTHAPTIQSKTDVSARHLHCKEALHFWDAQAGAYQGQRPV